MPQPLTQHLGCDPSSSQGRRRFRKLKRKARKAGFDDPNPHQAIWEHHVRKKMDRRFLDMRKSLKPGEGVTIHHRSIPLAAIQIRAALRLHQNRKQGLFKADYLKSGARWSEWARTFKREEHASI